MVNKTTATEVIAACCRALGTSPEEVLTLSRKDPEALYRHIIAYHLARAGYSRPSIGRMFGRNQSTITASIRAYERLQCWPPFRAWAEACREAVEGITANQKNEAA